MHEAAHLLVSSRGNRLPTLLPSALLRLLRSPRLWQRCSPLVCVWIALFWASRPSYLLVAGLGGRRRQSAVLAAFGRAPFYRQCGGDSEREVCDRGKEKEAGFLAESNKEHILTKGGSHTRDFSDTHCAFYSSFRVDWLSPVWILTTFSTSFKTGIFKVLSLFTLGSRFMQSASVRLWASGAEDISPSVKQDSPRWIPLQRNREGGYSQCVRERDGLKTGVTQLQFTSQPFCVLSLTIPFFLLLFFLYHFSNSTATATCSYSLPVLSFLYLTLISRYNRPLTDHWALVEISLWMRNWTLYY